jgi:hypothetical protein
VVGNGVKVMRIRPAEVVACNAAGSVDDQRGAIGRSAYFSTAAGRTKGRGLSWFMRGCRSSEPRITGWT